MDRSEFKILVVRITSGGVAMRVVEFKFRDTADEAYAQLVKCFALEVTKLYH